MDIVGRISNTDVRFSKTIFYRPAFLLVALLSWALFSTN